MNDLAAVDASPLIYLSRTSHLKLLRLAGEKIYIPTPVVREIMARGKLDPTAAALRESDWLLQPDPPPVPVNVEQWNLGAGESSVIALAASLPGCRVVIDDLQGRRCAEAMGIPLRGTLGLVLLAQRRGVIPLARPVLEELCSAGMYLSPQILDRALAEVGE